jgi:hypothetical protein
MSNQNLAEPMEQNTVVYEPGRLTPTFLGIPFEIREKIYRMLLTTAKCTTLEPTTLTLRFHLQPAILRINKQTSDEATTILYQKNHFVVLDVTGVQLDLGGIPQLSLLSQDKIMDPVLRVGVAVGDQTLVEFVNRQTIVTTPEGIDTIIHLYGRWRLAGIFLKAGNFSTGMWN